MPILTKEITIVHPLEYEVIVDLVIFKRNMCHEETPPTIIDLIYRHDFEKMRNSINDILNFKVKPSVLSPALPIIYVKLCRLTKTPFSGIVLDPFMGSGSTGVASILEGRPFIGIEQDEESYRTARSRLVDISTHGADFLEAKPKPQKKRVQSSEESLPKSCAKLFQNEQK